MTTLVHPSLSQASWRPPPPSVSTDALKREMLVEEMSSARHNRGGYSAFRRPPRPWEELAPNNQQGLEEVYWGSDASLCQFARAGTLNAVEHEEGHDEQGGVGEAEEEDDEEAHKTGGHCVGKQIFPPPISSPAVVSATKAPWLPPALSSGVSLRSVRQNGRLIVTSQEARSPPRFLVANREEGRLRLQLFVASEEQIPSAFAEVDEDEPREHHDGPLESSVAPKMPHQDEHVVMVSLLDMDPIEHQPHIPNLPPSSPLPKCVVDNDMVHQALSGGAHDPAPVATIPSNDSPTVNGLPNNPSLDSILKSKFVEHHHHHHQTVGFFLHESLARVRTLVY